MGTRDSRLLTKQAAKFDRLVKSKDRVQKVCADIVKHYREKVEPNGLKGPSGSI